MPPKKIAPGSPEDLQLTIDTLQKFFAIKIKKVDLFNAGKKATDDTAGTQSVCHIDGTTDPN